MHRRTLVVADVHLSHASRSAVAEDLARLVRESTDARIVLAGDVLDLSVAPSSIGAILGAHPALTRALAEHAENGAGLVWVAGNHDAAVGTTAGRAALVEALGLTGSRAGTSLRTTPWFFRDGAIHVEHGHAHDPDNVPAHPLVAGAPSLGVFFTESFLARTGAHAFLDANDHTPLSLLARAFRVYGARAPHIVTTFFHTAFAALARSGSTWERVAIGERVEGRALEAEFARDVDLDAAEIERLVAAIAPSTLADRGATFARMYLDRVAATALLAAGGVAVALGRRKLAAVLAGAGALAMATSWVARHDRYGGAVEARLRAGAARVAQITGARVVVMGHAHHAELDRTAGDPATYANTGTFAFERRRPFVEIGGSASAPQAVLRSLFC